MGGDVPRPNFQATASVERWLESRALDRALLGGLMSSDPAESTAGQATDGGPERSSGDSLPARPALRPPTSPTPSLTAPTAS